MIKFKLPIFTIAILIFLCSHSVVVGEKINQLRPVNIKSPPKIDGKLNDQCWEKIPTIKGFLPLATKGEIQDSEVKLGVDADNLYFGIVCHEKNIDKLVHTFKNHDDPIFTDDCIEIFITPNYFKQSPKLHYIVNCEGITYDAWTPDRGWSSSMKAAAEIEDKQWTLEVKIPLKDFNGQNKDLLGISVCRERWAGEKEYSIWPVGGSFHKPNGHVLLTDYKSFLKGPLNEWQRNKQDIIKLVTRLNASEKETLESSLQLINVIDQAVIDMFVENELSPAQFNEFLVKLRSIKLKIKGLRRKIAFMLFMDDLKKSVTIHKNQAK